MVSLPRPEPAVHAKPCVPPAASARPGRRSCRAAPLAPPSTPLPRSPPASSPLLPSALHTPAPHTHLYPEPAAPCGPASHSPSMAATATAHTPPAPCIPAASPTNASAVPPLPLLPFLSSRLPRRSPPSCNTPPTASPHLHPPAPPPPLPPPPRVAPGSLRSLPTRSDIPGSSPARRSAPQNQFPLPLPPAPADPPSPPPPPPPPPPRPRSHTHPHPPT